MRKFQWSVILCAGFLAALLAGCGGGSGTSNGSNLVGVWSLRSIKINNETPVVCGSVNSAGGLGTLSSCDPSQTVTFYANGVVQTFNGVDRGQAQWKLNGSKLTLTPGPGQAQADPVALTISQTGSQLIVTLVDTTASPPLTLQGTFERQSSQSPLFIPTTNPPSLFGSSGGGNTGINNGPIPRPVSDYAGTWSGPWTTSGVLGGQQPLLQTGTVTLTFDANGKITGQVVNTTTGLTSPVTGNLILDGTTTTGINNAVYPLANGISGFFLGDLIIDPSGHLVGALSLTPLPQDQSIFGNVVATFSLSRP